MHDADFRASEKDFDSFVAALTEQIIEKDATIPELPVKDLVRRCRTDWDTLTCGTEVSDIPRHPIQS